MDKKRVLLNVYFRMSKLKNPGNPLSKYYIFIFISTLLLGTILICIADKNLIKIAVAIVPLLIILTLYSINRPSSSLILFFLLIPLASPAFLPYSGITPAEVLAVPTILFCILSLSTGNKIPIQKTLDKNKHIFISIIMFSFFGFLSTIVLLTKDNFLINFSALTLKPLFMALILLVFLSRFKKDKIINTLIICMLITSFLIGFLCLYALVTLKPEWAIDPIALRVAATFPIYNHLSGYEVLIIFFLFGLYSNSNNIYFKTFLTLQIGLSFIAQIASLTLGGILGIVGGILFLILIKENKLRNLTISVALLAITWIAAYFLYPPIVNKTSIISERIMDRIIINYTGITMIKKQIWFGWGIELEDIMRAHPKFLYTPFGSGWCVPHNLFITTFATTGIFSLFALVYFVTALTKRIKAVSLKINLSKNKNFYISILAGLIAFFIQSMSNNLLWHLRLGTYAFLFIGFLLKFDEEGDFSFPRFMQNN